MKKLYICAILYLIVVLGVGSLVFGQAPVSYNYGQAFAANGPLTCYSNLAGWGVDQLVAGGPGIITFYDANCKKTTMQQLLTGVTATAAVGTTTQTAPGTPPVVTADPASTPSNIIFDFALPAPASVASGTVMSGTISITCPAGAKGSIPAGFTDPSCTYTLTVQNVTPAAAPAKSAFFVPTGAQAFAWKNLNGMPTSWLLPVPPKKLKAEVNVGTFQ